MTDQAHVREKNLGGGYPPRGCLPAEELEAALLVLLGGGMLRGLMSWTESFGAGSEGVDSTSRNFTNISEKDCNSRYVEIFISLSAGKFYFTS